MTDSTTHATDSTPTDAQKIAEFFWYSERRPHNNVAQRAGSGKFSDGSEFEIRAGSGIATVLSESSRTDDPTYAEPRKFVFPDGSEITLGMPGWELVTRETS